MFLCFVLEYVTVEPFEEDPKNSVDNGAHESNLNPLHKNSKIYNITSQLGYSFIVLRLSLIFTLPDFSSSWMHETFYPT